MGLFNNGIKKVIHEFFLILSLVFLASCASIPTTEEAANADYGLYPYDYEDVVKNYYSETLKDPYSVVYKYISTPKKYWLANRLEGAYYGYLVCVTLNAKNSYGAYVGYETDGLLIKNGRVIRYIERGVEWDKNICQ